jgi:DsbC/DsbD-like thiol-disulfide interchange protein
MAVELAPPAGAHLSWKHLGESGLPTVIELFGPPGFHIGPPRYPAPGRYPTTAGHTAVGYTGSFVVLAAVTPDATARFPEPDRPETHAAFQVHGTWLSCDTRCTKEEVHRTLKWNGSTSPLPELPQWLSNLPDDKPPLGFAARLHRKNNTIELFSPDDWQLEDAFIEADVAPGGSLAAFTRSAAGRYVLAPVSEPAGVVVKARAGNAASRHFLLSVTDE